MKRFLPLVFLCAAIAPGAAQDGPPVDAAEMLRALEGLRQKQEEAVTAQRTRAIRDFRAAAASNSTAVDFFEDAVRATQFQGQSREAGQFREWKKKEADKLRNAQFQTAVRLNLNYLVLSLRLSGEEEIESIFPALLQHVADATQNREAGPGGKQVEKLIGGGIGDGIFTRWYQLEGVLKGVSGWETDPANVEGIYEKTILPEWRRTANRRIVEYWDGKIAFEAAKAAESGLEFNAAQFDENRRPALLWSRAQDMLAIGLKNRALSEMFAIVKNFPYHPQAGQWSERLEALLTAPPAQPSTASAAAGD